jgi:hypothetical protein
MLSIPPPRRFEIARLDRLRSADDGAEPGAAHLVDGDAADRGREAAVDGRLPRRVLSEAGLEDAPHDALADVVGGDVRALHRFTESDGSELGSGEGAQST